MVAEDPVTTRVREELAAEGVDFNELLNAGKVVSLTRKVDALTYDIARAREGSDEYGVMQGKLAKLEGELVSEKRQVMQTWLKRLFLVQAFVFIAVGGLLSNDAVPGVASVPLVGQALGFWMTWLFTIPALRARKGTSKAEKSALNVAFLLTPFINVGLPTITKNCGAIWAADVAFLAACYAWYAAAARADGSDGGNDGDVEREQGRIKGILKYLDWGSWR